MPVGVRYHRREYIVVSGSPSPKHSSRVEMRTMVSPLVTHHPKEDPGYAPVPDRSERQGHRTERESAKLTVAKSDGLGQVVVFELNLDIPAETGSGDGHYC